MKIGCWIGILASVFLSAMSALGSGAEGKEIIFEDESLKKRIYLQLGKEEDSLLYEEELKECKGQLLLTGDISVYRGEELDILLTYFQLENVDCWNVYFTPDLEGWTEEQLEGLGELKQEVSVCSIGAHTVPASVLPYFTGTEELCFKVTDVTGQIPEGKAFPDNVKNVVFNSYATARYQNLLEYMQGSGVESLVLQSDYLVDTRKIFWLDEVAGCENLEYLDLDDSRIRVWEAEKLEGMKLRELTGVIDKETDFSFLDMLSSLEKVTGAVAEERDLAPLLEKEELGLRLRFCQEVVEFEEDIYPEGMAAANPEWDAYFGWKEEDEEDGNFLAIYQRYMDEGRKAECFSVRARYGEGERDGYQSDMYPVRTFLRVTDGEKVSLLNSAEGAGTENLEFGKYRRDDMQFMDINFDGVKDIVLDRGSYGSKGVSYKYGWIWDGERKEYVFLDSYATIINPRPDGKNKLVRSSWTNGFFSHSWAIYRYENGEFVLKSIMTEELLGKGDGAKAPEGSWEWQWEERIYENDWEAVETNCFTVMELPGGEMEYPEEYYRFYEGDSYWGG